MSARKRALIERIKKRIKTRFNTSLRALKRRSVLLQIARLGLMVSMWAQLYIALSVELDDLSHKLLWFSFVYLTFDIVRLTGLSVLDLMLLPGLLVFFLSLLSTPLSLTTLLSLSLSLMLYLLFTLHALREKARLQPAWARTSATFSEDQAPHQLRARLPLNLWGTLSVRSKLFVMWCLSAPVTLSLSLSASAQGGPSVPPPHSLNIAVMMYLGLICAALIKSELSQGENTDQEAISAARDVRRKRHIIATVCLTFACAYYTSQLL